MILLIDNYDSFTYNLYHYLGELGVEVRVFRNDEITLQQIEELAPEKIVISPGPCTPKEAGISCDVIRRFGEKTPILGVCLGHQCIAAAFGGEIIRAPSIMHGKMSQIFHDSQMIYRSLKIPSPLCAITPWSSTRTVCRQNSTLAPAPPTMSSWACAT